MGQMLQWEGKIVDNTNVQLLKAALPYLDQPVGNRIDLEGLLRSIRGFCCKNERKCIDFLLQIFMFRRVHEMMAMMQEQQENASGMGSMMDFLKSQIPPEQQEMVDMMSVFMSAMSEEDHEQSGRDVCKDAPGESEDSKAARGTDKGNRDEGSSTICDAGNAGTSQPESVIYPGGVRGDDGNPYP
ncbi:MAG: hypothetical protein ACI4SQ_00870 [Eubacterium sp.]